MAMMAELICKARWVLACRHVSLHADMGASSHADMGGRLGRWSTHEHKFDIEEPSERESQQQLSDSSWEFIGASIRIAIAAHHGSLKLSRHIEHSDMLL